MSNNGIATDVARIFQDIGLDIRQLGGLIGDYRYSDQEQYREIKSADFGVQLGSGSRPGFTVEAGRTSITGAPGIICTSQIRVDGSAILRNMTLVCDGNTPALVVGSSGRCVLQGCHIVKAPNISGASDMYIEVEDAGYLNVVGCMFHGTQSSGYVVYNDSVHHNFVDVTGCVNDTGVGHRHVTVVGEVP